MAGLKDTISMSANVLVILAALVIVFRPDGGFRSYIAGKIDQASLRTEAQDRWDDLTSEGGTIPLGAAGGDTIVVFTDYECPFCRASESAVRIFGAERQQGVVVLYRHLPLEGIHPLARAAAVASICAEEQGAFGEMHRRLFEDTDWRTSEDWTTLASQSGVSDLGRFGECLEAPRTAQRLDRDVTLAAEIGVTGTPTWLSARSVRVGQVDVEMLDGLVGGERE